MADLMTWMQQFHSTEMHSSYDLHPIQIDLAPSATSLVWLTSRFKLASQREDIDEAIHAYRQSLELLVISHPSVASVSTISNTCNLERALMTVYTDPHESKYLGGDRLTVMVEHTRQV